MGVVNVTPDSFSDGGRYLDPDAAVAHGVELAGQGAAILDVGGESTRPGADPVEPGEELRRVVPVVRGLARALPQATLSVDTSKAEVARQAVAAGATVVNDVSALRADPELVDVVAQAGVELLPDAHARRAAHDAGRPPLRRRGERGQGVPRAAARVRGGPRGGRASASGSIPGIGFGKTARHNLELLARLDEIVALGRPVVVGTSRKTFLGRLAGGRDTGERLPGTIATNVMAFERGAAVFRVHDVAAVVDALAVAGATVAAVRHG